MQSESVHSVFGAMAYLGKKSLSALYPTKGETSPNLSRYLSTFCERKPATMAIVVGKDAAQTPGRWI